ncbi:hypothetical protein ACE3NQ_06605 [Paenibacillus terreus]|uniref:Uncharacterized protein n=1 Tax=Paenibacillus terreus TaxID=1387834 RepID=A0ABV5B4G6_9BACL
MKVLVISDLYNRIFAVQQSHPDLYVEYSIWNRINMGLPEEYTLPDQRILSVLLEERK